MVSNVEALLNPQAFDFLLGHLSAFPRLPLLQRIKLFLHFRMDSS
jgi:hypothetical protein